MTTEAIDEYDFFFAIKSNEVDAWDIGSKPLIISKTNYLIGQYVETCWFAKPVFKYPHNSYECIVLKIKKNTNRKNMIMKQLNYLDVHHSNIYEVYLYGVISSSDIMDAKDNIQTTMIDTQNICVSVPVYAKISHEKQGKELIITLQGRCNNKYPSDITYQLTLPLFKTPI